MNTTMSGFGLMIQLLMILFGLIWMLMPFVIIAISRRLSSLTAEARETNAQLRRMVSTLAELRTELARRD